MGFVSGWLFGACLHGFGFVCVSVSFRDEFKPFPYRLRQKLIIAQNLGLDFNPLRVVSTMSRVGATRS